MSVYLHILRADPVLTALDGLRTSVMISTVLQGIVYSDSAAANYGDPAYMTSAAPLIPAKRLGTVEEVGAC